MVFPSPDITVVADEDAVAQTVADELLAALIELQAARGPGGLVSLVITGGGTGINALKAMRHHPALLELDWSRVEIWWSDERHVEPSDPERNEKQAMDALLGYLDLDRMLLHPAPWAPDMPADVAAAALAQELELRPDPDIVLVGLGPDIHVGSLFPGFNILLEDPERAIAVHGAPKPPPERITLTLPSFRRASEVWIITAGSAKAGPVRAALTGIDVNVAPACGARGKVRTRFIVDHAAAELIDDLISPLNEGNH